MFNRLCVLFLVLFASLGVTSDFGCANPIRVLFAAPSRPARLVRIDASVDRIEEDRLVLDVAGYPSLPVPLDLDASLREGSAVTVEVFVRADAGAGGAKELHVLEAGDPLRLELAGARPFRWPAPLAPRAETGGRLWMRLLDDPARAAQRSRDIERLRSELHGP